MRKPEHLCQVLAQLLQQLVHQSRLAHSRLAWAFDPITLQHNQYTIIYYIYYPILYYTILYYTIVYFLMIREEILALGIA